SPTTIERNDGTNCPSSGTPRPAGSAAERAVVLRRAATRLTSPRRPYPLHRRELERAQQLHLVLQLDPELIVHAAPRLGHQREAIRRGRPVGVLDEVRVPGRDERA